MTRLSSNFTIVLKLFIPILYVVFFGSYLIASFLISVDDSPLLASPIFKMVYGSVFCLFILLFYFTILKIKRVDANGEKLAITNYIKTYQYPWSDVDYIKTRNYGLFRTMRIYFKGKTSFGKKISFIPSEAMVEDFVRKYPDIGTLISEQE